MNITNGLAMGSRIHAIVILTVASLMSSCVVPNPLVKPTPMDTQAPSRQEAAHNELPLPFEQPLAKAQGGLTAVDTPAPPPRPIQALPPQTEIYPGTGTFIDGSTAKSGPPVKNNGAGEYSLNFEAMDLQEVVKAILGDLLKQNYIIDPKVTGLVTLQTSHPLRREELLPTLENLLRLNAAVLIEEGGSYKILPQEQAVGGHLSATIGKNPSARGYAVHIVPLRYISAREMHKIIEPYTPADAPAMVDEQRNLLILTGTQAELKNLIALVDMFDVDWLRGMSVGLFRLRKAQAKTLITELESIFGGKDGPLGGWVRFVPIERMNAILAVSGKAEHLQTTRNWIEHLDKAEETQSVPRLFVYRVKNGKAKDLAAVLAGIFGAETPSGGTGVPAPELAPGEISATVGRNDTVQPGGDTQALVGGTEAANPDPSNGQLTVVANEQVRIIADQRNNSLVIMAKPQDYQMIEETLKSLDVVPLQVLIEASVVEITLTDTLQYGVEWFMNHTVAGGGKGAMTSGGALGGGGAVNLANAIPGTPSFTYAVLNANNKIQVLLEALSRESKVDVLSSPSLMVLDNQTATIKVVDQVPIITQSRQSTQATDAPIVSNVEYKDAGVILEVTPQVNLGGRITLDLQQDVTDVGEVESNTGNRRFLQRNIKSTVTVQSGETIVLGGLIKKNSSLSKSGVPFVKDIPLLGNLFSTTAKDSERKELIVLLTPKAVRSENEAHDVTDEYRQRLQELKSTMSWKEPRPGVGSPVY
jgi:general secretion pathway protein D